MPDELKPCPACGKDGRERSNGNGVAIYCTDYPSCGFKTGFYSKRELAIDAWNRRPLEEKQEEEQKKEESDIDCLRTLKKWYWENPEGKPVDAILIDNCSCGGTGVLASYRDRSNSDYLLHRVRCEKCGLCTTLLPDAILAQKAWRDIRNNPFLREAHRCGLKNPEQYLKPELRENKYNLRETLLQAGRAMGCKECGRPGMLMLHYNDPTGDKNRPPDGYYVMHPPDRNCSVWNLHRLQPATAIHSQAKEAIEEWNEKFGRKPEPKPASC